MIIYRVTNKDNGKIYIGQTTCSLIDRKKSHLNSITNGNKTYFANSIYKHGAKKFKWEVICICYNIDLLNQMEQYYISLYNSMNPELGYNLQSGGLNFIMADSVKIKMSNSAKGEKNSNFDKTANDKTRAKMRLAKQNMSKEFGKKLSIIRKEWHRKHPDYYKGKNHPMYGVHKFGKDAPNYGNKHSKESNDKNRASVLRWHKNNPGALGGKNHPNYGKHRSEETKQKIRDGNKLWCKNHPNATKGKNNPNYNIAMSSEQKLKISNALKEYYRNKKENNNG